MLQGGGLNTFFSFQYDAFIWVHLFIGYCIKIPFRARPLTRCSVTDSLREISGFELEFSNTLVYPPGTGRITLK